MNRVFGRPGKKTFALLLSSAFLMANAALASDPASPISVVDNDARFTRLIAPGAKAQVLTADAQWAEGPLCLADGRLIWSDVKANKVMSWKEGEGVTPWLDPAHYQNGHARDAEGRVIAASHGERAIVRQEADGQWRTLVDRYQGKRLNSPNDVVVDDSGNIWFSDPTFGVLNKAESYGGKPEQGGEYLYRYDPKRNELTRLETPGLHSPNGLAFSPDQRLLYVADSQLAHDFKNPKLAHRIMVYQVNNGALSNGRTFVEVSPGIADGVKVDEQGNVWSSSKEGIQVFSAKGELLGKLLIAAKDTGNLTFCSTGSQPWVYITAANKVLRIPALVKGARP
ncbi:SMP-30/gluconolactonase/LRE family protein [Pseudomonas cannabina]|uniref:SMP-30/gluconolactonase/LRE family protein n=3 Tax=Pseudomonas syringae group TaxID=136849 RepID=A0A8T8BYQ3_PSEYM|nr:MULTISPECIES: SMP-30/gluconolactonase/LRE family protein [Pseudomonas syringae group]KPB76956.1 Gluconolactonase [Pseudomonas syringae pv. maculicola]MBM0138944.1 SMP-30/gluconolactonase/LRE family protein [Pseudomonas cannabina pv. alisalensis]QHE96247.1 SMP-30/gluconolactonase/LRE family protein [Pseudomonas syringae pv. maculicola str. ES4326]QQN20693.1 SMP-30/gluconolactonase/LRE family protein [Pseudomonas cannabina pv. alisalensis]RMN87230.1 Gluconolactonase [Pseudomonas cannabina]